MKINRRWFAAAGAVLLVTCAAPPEDHGELMLGSARLGLVEDHPLDRAAKPQRNFDLSRWKLTVPSGRDIPVEQLNSGYTQVGVFFTDVRSGGMVFRCPNRAGTTDGSNYARTELREMRQPSGPARARANNWTPEEGGTLSARLAVDRVSTTGPGGKRGRVVIGQIHGPDSEVVRLYYEKQPGELRGRIYAGLDSFENKTTWSPDIVPNLAGGGIALGEVFDYRIRLKNRALEVAVQQAAGPPQVYRKKVDRGYLGENLYFKAGVYNQNSGGDDKDYAQATFFALAVTHP